MMKNYTKTFDEFINESKGTKSDTSDYTPPKYLVSPALAQDGSGIPDDKMVKYMEDEVKKRKPYFKPGIKSANPPTFVDEDFLQSDEE
jgi:hypothetical protein